MKIQEVAYIQLFSFDRFQNESIGYTAELEQNEAPELVLEELRKKAIPQHRLNQQTRDQGQDISVIDTLEKQCSNKLKDQCRQLKNRLRDQDYELTEVSSIEETINYTETRLKELAQEKEQNLRRLAD